MQIFREISQFSLETHQGEYEMWPAKTKLYTNQNESKISLKGYHLNEQLETETGYMLILDCNCPYEEVLFIYFLSKDMQILSTKTIGDYFWSIGNPGVYSRKKLTENELIFSFDEQESLYSLQVKDQTSLLSRNWLILKKISLNSL